MRNNNTTQAPKNQETPTPFFLLYIVHLHPPPKNTRTMHLFVILALPVLFTLWLNFIYLTAFFLPFFRGYFLFFSHFIEHYQYKVSFVYYYLLMSLLKFLHIFCATCTYIDRFFLRLCNLHKEQFFRPEHHFFARYL